MTVTQHTKAFLLVLKLKSQWSPPVSLKSSIYCSLLSPSQNYISFTNVFNYSSYWRVHCGRTMYRAVHNPGADWYVGI